MPVIPQFTAPGAMSVIRPNETGEQATVRAAMRIEEMGAQAGRTIGRAIAEPGEAVVNAVGDYVQRADVTKGGMAITDLNNKTMLDYNQQSKTWDPDDPTAPQKFLEQYKSNAQKIVDNAGSIKGQEWIQGQAREGASHFGNVIIADTAFRAGAAQVDRYNQSIINLQNMVSNDVSYLPNAMAQADSLFENGIKSPNIDARGIAELQRAHEASKKTIAESALRSQMAADPVSALKAIQSGTYSQWLPTGDTMLVGQAAVRLKQSEDRANMFLALEQKRQANQDQQDRIMAQVQWDDNGNPTVPPGLMKDTFLHSDKLGGLVVSTLSALRSLSEPKSPAQLNVPNDPTTISNFQQRIVSSDPTQRPTDAEIMSQVGHTMNGPTARYFQEQLHQIAADPSKLESERQIMSFYNSMKGYIRNPLETTFSPMGAQREQDFYQDTRSLALENLSKGVPLQKTFEDMRSRISDYIPSLKQQTDAIQTSIEGHVQPLAPVAQVLSQAQIEKNAKTAAAASIEAARARKASNPPPPPLPTPMSNDRTDVGPVIPPM